MKDTILGLNANGNPIRLTRALRRSTHMHVIGGSGTGKSKFLESLIRGDIRNNNGLCLIDWHGTLYQSILRFCANLDIGLEDCRNVILIDPCKSDFITGFNPFMNQGADISVQVNNRIAATIKPWGITDTNQMPTFERVCRLLYTFAVELEKPLHVAAQLLQFDKPELRRYAANVVSDRYIREQWQQLLSMTNFKDWVHFVLSAENRLGRFLGAKAIKRFMGLTTGNLNLREVMDEGKIVLVNLGASGFLDREAARVFASLFLNEFFETTMLRANDSPQNQPLKTFGLYLDEFQEYITDDIAAMLDQVRKGGLHIVLAHQHLAHLNDSPRLLQSVLTNARIRAVFGGLSYGEAAMLADEMFLPDLNTRQIKKAYYHTNHVYEEQTRIVRSFGRTSGSSYGISTSRSLSGASTRGTSKTVSRTFGRGSSKAHSSGATSGYVAGFSESTSQTHGMALSAGNTLTTPTRQPLLAIRTQGWFADSESSTDSRSISSSQTESRSLSDSYSDSDSYSESEFSSDGKADTISESMAESEGFAEGEIFGWSDAETESETEVPVWVPIPIQELGSEAEWSREEKVSKVAEMLKTQQQRHCFIKLDTERTQPLMTPFVKDYSLPEEFLISYEQAIYQQQGALPAAQVDVLVDQQTSLFLASINSIRPADEPVVQLSEVKQRKQLRSGSARRALFSAIEARASAGEE